MAATPRTPARRSAGQRVRKRITAAPRRAGKRLLVRGVIAVGKRVQSYQDEKAANLSARRDAALLQATHDGCTVCGGLGTIATHDKTGKFTGSKSCTAPVRAVKVSRWQLAKQARFGADKTAGLYGWRCPCPRKDEKPRFRTAKDAGKAMASHNRRYHGGANVGSAVYLHDPAGKAPAPVQKPAASPSTTKRRPKPRPTTPKPPTRAGDDPARETRLGPVNPLIPNPHSGLTDEEWLHDMDKRAVPPGGCTVCKGTTFVPKINPDARNDYERQVMERCTNCFQGVPLAGRQSAPRTRRR